MQASAGLGGVPRALRSPHKDRQAGTSSSTQNPDHRAVCGNPYGKNSPQETKMPLETT